MLLRPLTGCHNTDKNKPGLLPALVHLGQFNISLYIDMCHSTIYNMVMHVNVQGYQILLSGGLAPKIPPFLFFTGIGSPKGTSPFPATHLASKLCIALYKKACSSFNYLLYYKIHSRWSSWILYYIFFVMYKVKVFIILTNFNAQFTCIYFN